MSTASGISRHARLPFSLLLAATASILALSSCAVESADRGVTYGSPTRVERTGLRAQQIEVVLIHDNGRTMPGVRVDAEAPRSVDSDTTNSNGVAVINLQLAENDTVDFHFSGPQHRIEWTRTLYSLPREPETIRLLFKVDSQGQVRMTELEFD